MILSPICIYLLHVIHLVWFDKAAPLVWASAGMFALFTLVAWRKPALRNLWLAYAGALPWEVATYSGSWPVLTWALTLVGFTAPLLLVARVPSWRRLAMYGLWIGVIIYTTAASGTLQSIRNFWVGGALTAPLLLFFLLTLFMGAQFAVAMGVTGYLFHRLRLGPLPVLFCLVYLVVEYWMPFPFPKDPSFMLAGTPLLIQIVDLIGSRGVTLVCLLTAGGLFTLISPVARAATSRRGRIAWVAVLIAAPLFQVGYGMARMRNLAPAEGQGQVDLAMIQPCSPLHILNKDHAEKLRVAANLLALSREAMGTQTGRLRHESPPDMLIWPEGEGAFQYLPPEFAVKQAYNPEYLDAVRKIQRETPVPLLLSDVVFDAPSDGADPSEGIRYRYRNHISLVGRDGHVTGEYTKLIRVPFAEYLPFEQDLIALERYSVFRQLRWMLRKAAPSVRSVKQGRDYSIFYGPKDAPFAAVICYEAIFEDHVRTFVLGGAKYLVNLANEGWFATEAMRRHSMRVALIRTVENRIPLVRATNSGISVISDARGVIQATAPDGKVAILRAKITPGPAASVYLSFGYLVPKWGLTPLLLGLWAYGYLVAWRRRPKIAPGTGRRGRQA